MVPQDSHHYFALSRLQKYSARIRCKYDVIRLLSSALIFLQSLSPGLSTFHPSFMIRWPPFPQIKFCGHYINLVNFEHLENIFYFLLLCNCILLLPRTLLVYTKASIAQNMTISKIYPNFASIFKLHILTRRVMPLHRLIMPLSTSLGEPIVEE